jgi:hypothetical protein
MSSGMNDFWNGVMAVAQSINRNKKEGDVTNALKAMNGSESSNNSNDNTNSNTNYNQLLQAMYGGNNGNSNITLGQLAQNATNNNSYDFARDIQALNSQSSNPLLRAMASSQGSNNASTATDSNANTAQTNAYNAGSDYGVDLNNPYSMAIMNAKNDYYRAQKLGDENAMLQSNAVAEQARQQAQANGVPIQSFLANNNTDYGQALAMNDQLRQAQVNGNQNFSYADLASGRMFTPQVTNPTQGLNEQQPTSAGTATATAAKGVTVPSVGNQQTVQTPTAPSTYDIQAGWNQYMNSLNGGSAQQNPFLGVGRGRLY